MVTNDANRHRSSILLVSVGNIAGAAAQWYIIWLFARFAGPEAVGVYSSLVAVMSPIFITTQLGLRNLYITLQSVVSWRAYVCLRVVGIMTACSLTLGALLILAPRQALSIGFAILVIKIANSTADLYLARIQRTERLRIFGLLLLLDALTTMAVITATMLISGSVLLALWAGAVVALLGAVITVFLASNSSPYTKRRRGGPVTTATAISGDIAAIVT